MLTKTERKKFESALKKIRKCNGICIKCEKLHLYFGGNEKALYMAVGCDVLPNEHFDYIANVPSELHEAAIETLEFELS